MNPKILSSTSRETPPPKKTPYADSIHCFSYEHELLIRAQLVLIRALATNKDEVLIRNTGYK
jgi:hypothetical protein